MNRYQYKLNHIPSPSDARDFQIGRLFARPVRASDVPETADLRPFCSRIEDQGELGSCGPNALVGAMELINNKSSVPAFDYSRLFVYGNTRAIMGTFAEDSGVDNRSLFKAAKRFGICREDLWPYDISKFRHVPGRACYRDALKRQVTAYARLRSLEEIMEVVGVQRLGVVIATAVYESFMSEDVANSGFVPIPDTKTEKRLGFHDMLIVGYDRARRLLLVRNSWGAAWGIGGYCWIPFEVVERGIADEFWAVTSQESGEEPTFFRGLASWAAARKLAAAAACLALLLAAGCAHVTASGDWGKVSYWTMLQDREIGPITIQGTNVLMSVESAAANGVSTNVADIAAAVTKAAIEAAK